MLSNQLTVDRDEVIKFFELLFDSEPWPGFINIDFIYIWIENGKKKSKFLNRMPLGGIEHVKSLNMSLWSQLQMQEGNVFFTNAFMSTGKNKKDNVVAISALWADVDYVDDNKLQQLLKDCPKLPTGWIRSGNGIHFYWKLKSYCFEVEHGGRVDKALVKVHAWVTGDHTHNKNRVLRVPGTYNVKPEYTTNGHTPPFTKILHWNNDVVYDLEDIIGTPLAYKEIRTAEIFKEKYILLGECTFDGKEDRSKRDFMICCEMLIAKHSDEEIEQVLTNPMFGCSSKAVEEGVWSKYVKTTIESARASVQALITGFSVYDDPSKGLIYRKRVNSKMAVEEEVISNFCLIPKSRVIVAGLAGESEEVLDAQLHTNFGRSQSVRLSPGSLVYPEKLISEYGFAMCSFFGSRTEFYMYVDYLSRQEVAVSNATKIIGWTGDSFVVPGKTLTGPPIEFIDHHGLSPHIKIVEESLELTPKFMQEFIRNTVNLHQSSASLLSLGWALASAFAPQIRKQYHDQFPILCIHGAPSTGKTTLVRTWMRDLFGHMDDLSGETTKAVVLRTLSTNNAIPTLIDEFDAVELTKSSMNMILRAVWQAGFAPRMARGVQEKISKTRLVAPTAVTSIIGIEDEACQDRAVNLRVQKIPNSGKLALKWFDNLPQGAFIKAWIQQDPTLWINTIGPFGEKLLTSPRQQHCFGTAVAPLIYIGIQYGIPELNIDRLAAYWGGQKEIATSPINVIDQMLAYLIRNNFLINNMKGYKAEGNKMFFAQASTVDLLVESCKKLDLAFPVDRKWITRTIHDGVDNGEVEAINKQSWLYDKNVRCFIIDVTKFPLVKEALSLV